MELPTQHPNTERMKPKYFMDYVARDAASSSGWKGLGCEMLTELPKGRKICSEGMQDFTLTENIELHRGPKIVTVKASTKKPVTGYTIIYPLGGETEFVHPLDHK